MFTQAGNVKVEITRAYFTTSKYKKEDPYILDICLEARTEDGQQDGFWTGEVSENYGRGSVSDKLQVELTVKTLQGIGWRQNEPLEKLMDEMMEIVTTRDVVKGDELLKPLVGVKTIGKVVREEKTSGVFYNLKYLGQSEWRPPQLSKMPRIVNNQVVQPNDTQERDPLLG